MLVCPITDNTKFDHLAKGVTARSFHYKDVFFPLQFINNWWGDTLRPCEYAVYLQSFTQRF